jgi:type I restriction enzyme S subunit
MSEKKNTPSIRFKGFTDAWEQRKLSEVADKVTEKNVDLVVQETFTNSAEYGVISQRDFFDHDISNAENIGGYYVVRNEDFVYNPRISVTAPVGPVNRNKLGRNGVMSPLYTVFRTHDIDTTYLEWFFKSSYWHPFMFFNGDSGARSDRFSIKDAVFFEMPIPTPSLVEQSQVGAYMDKLDNLITLHQRKHHNHVLAARICLACSNSSTKKPHRIVRYEKRGLIQLLPVIVPNTFLWLHPR